MELFFLYFCRGYVTSIYIHTQNTIRTTQSYCCLRDNIAADSSAFSHVSIFAPSD